MTRWPPSAWPACSCGSGKSEPCTTKGSSGSSAALDAAGDAAPIGERAGALRAQVDLQAGKGIVRPTGRARWRTPGPERARRSRFHDRSGIPQASPTPYLAWRSWRLPNRFPSAADGRWRKRPWRSPARAGDERLVAFALRARALARSEAEGTIAGTSTPPSPRCAGSAALSSWWVCTPTPPTTRSRRATPSVHRLLLERALPLARDLGDPERLSPTCTATSVWRRSSAAISSAHAPPSTSSSGSAESTSSGSPQRGCRAWQPSPPGVTIPSSPPGRRERQPQSARGTRTPTSAKCSTGSSPGPLAGATANPSMEQGRCLLRLPPQLRRGDRPRA